MVAGLAQTLIITPVDLLKIRQQIQTSLPSTPGYVGPLQLLVRVLRREGITGAFYTHLPACQACRPVDGILCETAVLIGRIVVVR